MATLTVKQDGTAQYTTIQAAASAAALFDTILIQDSGTYTGQLNLESYIPGGWTKLVNIHADTNCNPIWDGTSAGNVAGVRLASAMQGNIFGGVMTVKGIKFQNWNANFGAGSGVFWISNAHVVQLERCTFQDCAGYTLNFARGDAGNHCLLDRCTWRNCGPTVFCNSAERYIDHKNCDVYPKSGSSAIDVYWAESTVSFTTVVTRAGNGQDGIRAGTVRNSVVRNLAGNSGTYGIRAFTDVAYCDAFGTWAFPYAGTQGASCLQVDPLFVNEGALDFHLQAGSPLLNAGVDVGITVDRDGNTRPAGAGYDIGAFEKIAEVTGAVCTTPNTVRVSFSAAVAVTGALTTPGNYTLAQVNPANGVLPTISAVTPQAGGSPTYVDLTTTEHTGGQNYSVTLANIPGVAGSAQYAGVGQAPTATSAEVLAPDLIRVRFSEPMLEDAALLSPSSYGFLPAPGATDPMVPFVVTVTPEAGGAPTYVDLSIGGGRRNTHYTLRVKA